jgi:hypothetical protein
MTAESPQSTRLDVAVFGLAFVLGVIAYLGIRGWLGNSAQILVTSTLVALMAAYAAAIVWVPRLRVRMDQAGDNSYYLGLLFTLGSMAFALYDFRTVTQGSPSATGVQQIISNFGIALATTIVGIFLRVALHQMRVDPADLEAVTRIELTEAAERLRATLDTATTDLGRFHLELQQRSSDVMVELSTTVKKTAADMNQHTAEAAVRLTTAAEEAYQGILSRTRDLTQSLVRVATEATAAIERLRGVEPPPLTLSRRLDKVAGVLEQVAVQSERTTEAFRAMTDVTTHAVESAAKTSDTLEKLAIRMRDEDAQLADVFGKTAKALAETLSPFSSSLQQVLGQAAELNEQLKQSTGESLKAQQAATEVLNHLAVLARGITEVLRSPTQVPHARS